MARIEMDGFTPSTMFESFFGVKPSVAVRYEFLTCAECGTPFAVEAHRVATLRKDGKRFYCPNGHHLVFNNGESEADKLKKELALEAKKREQMETQLAAQKRDAKAAWGIVEEALKERDAARRQTAAQKGVITRMKTRAANGVCPCCNRTFANLQRHMKGQHPDYAATSE